MNTSATPDSPQALLSRLWQDYAAINPQARQIHDLLGRAGETIVNDHLALRTFDDPRVGLDVMAGAWMRLGYQPRGHYTFPEKKLAAVHYEHPDASLPKVFISQLKLGELAPEVGKRVTRILDQMPGDLPARPDFPVAGRPWRLAYADYEALRAHSEYAAWVAAFGFRANHFTVLVNALKKFSTLQALNDFLKGHGFQLNTSGGEIKGSPRELLEQSSTLASQINVDFADAPRIIPGCYYEFARRYPGPDGKLYGGFVAASADKIFESTDSRRQPGS